MDVYARLGVRPVHLSLGLAVLLAAGGGVGVKAATADPASALRPVDPGDLPTLLDDGDVASLREAIGRSLGWLARQSPGRRFVFGTRTVTLAEQAQGFRRLLDLLADDPTPERLEERVRDEFDVFAAAGRPAGALLVTGYHEPIIEASLAPTSEYRVPILRVPDGFAAPSGLPAGSRRRAYLSRAEIERDLWSQRGLVLAWARDPIDVFFMEIEGSGTLRLPDGREVRVGYAATNNRPYRSVGRLLIDEGRIDEEMVSMPAIRAWLLAASPAERARVMRHNEAYVFFRRLDGPPVGSLGVTLTPGRSIATDDRLFPAGALAFVRAERPTVLPDGRLAWRSVSRFVLNQDTGGAIRGPGRVDVFWGRGVDADLAAGLMKQFGALHFLVPKARGLAAGSR